MKVAKSSKCSKSSKMFLFKIHKTEYVYFCQHGQLFFSFNCWLSHEANFFISGMRPVVPVWLWPLASHVGGCGWFFCLLAFKKYLFIWLRCVWVAAREIFHCSGLVALAYLLWACRILIPWLGIDQTYVPCIVRHSLNHWTTREVSEFVTQGKECFPGHLRRNSFPSPRSELLTLMEKRWGQVRQNLGGTSPQRGPLWWILTYLTQRNRAALQGRGGQDSENCKAGKVTLWRVDSTQRKVKVLVTQLCLTICDPMDCSLPGFSVHGIIQVRILEWVVISFSQGSSQPRDRTHVSCIAGRFFTTEPPKWI